MNKEGLLLINKDKEITSFNVVNKLRKILNEQKIGHCGTLDKHAAGLLLICVGRAVKLTKYLIGLDKKYIATIEFGKQTTTDDKEGKIINSYNGNIDFNVIKEKLKQFKGKINQSPPNYSAIHINGKRAYKLANEKKDFIMKQREVNIYDINIINFNSPYLTIEIFCSSGTYIRSIARDLGLQTGYFGYLSDLVRTKIGDYELKDSIKIEEVNNETKFILPEDILKNFSTLNLKDKYVSNMKNGNNIELFFFSNIDQLEDNKYYKVINNDKLISIIKYYNKKFYYELVY